MDFISFPARIGVIIHFVLRLPLNKRLFNLPAYVILGIIPELRPSLTVYCGCQPVAK